MSSDRALTSEDDHAKLCADIQAAVRSRAPLLISGEHQTTRLVARLVHERSGRGLFVRVCPKALSDGLAAFRAGAEGGSVSRRDAAAGDTRWTLFIEDIDQLTQATQEQLFHLIGVIYARNASVSHQQASPEVRVVGASARDLSLAVAAGTFHRDLFYRLNAIHLALPSAGGDSGKTRALVDSLLRATAGSVDPDTHPLSVSDLERLLTTDPAIELSAWQSLLQSLG